ncbi:TRAP transporter small permease [Dysosmobacter sp. Marseille-Q4140]|nr:TRAP transporter small permease [Dysosmobacter sp. Marseille-Q4140]
MLKKLDKTLIGIEKAVLVLGIFTPIIIIAINVVLRNFFTNAITWAEEYARYCIITVTFVGLGVAVREKAHMRITAVYDCLGSLGKYMMDLLVNVVAFFVSGFLFYEGMRITIKVAVTAQISASLALPMWMLYATLPLGCALMMLRLVQVTVALVREHKKEERA